MNLYGSIVIIALFILWFVLFYIIGCVIEAIKRYIRNSMSRWRKQRTARARAIRKGE